MFSQSNKNQIKKMKKTILTVVLSVLLGVTAYSQRKIATDKLQIKSLPNVGVLGTDAKGNLIESAGGGGAGNLQQVLTKGNTTSLDINFEGNDDYYALFSNDKLALFYDGCMGNCDGMSSLDLNNSNKYGLSEDDLLTVIKPDLIQMKKGYQNPYGQGSEVDVVTINHKKIAIDEVIDFGQEYIRTTLNRGMIIKDLKYNQRDFRTEYKSGNILISNYKFLSTSLKNTVNLELPKPPIPLTSSEVFNRKVVFPVPTQDTDTIVYKSNFNALKTIKFNPITTPTAPTAGTIYFDSSDNKLKCYDGTAWQSLW